MAPIRLLSQERSPMWRRDSAKKLNWLLLASLGTIPLSMSSLMKTLWEHIKSTHWKIRGRISAGIVTVVSLQVELSIIRHLNIRANHAGPGPIWWKKAESASTSVTQGGPPTVSLTKNARNVTLPATLAKTATKKSARNATLPTLCESKVPSVAWSPAPAASSTSQRASVVSVMLLAAPAKNHQRSAPLAPPTIKSNSTKVSASSNAQKANHSSATSANHAPHAAHARPTLA